ncbi:MAG: transcriptional regulator [Paracoccaceae bacterium]|jgi:transcriptional regulator
MHTNPSFRKTPDETSLEFARQRGFGIMSVNGETVPLNAHIPFLLSDDGTKIEAHMTRSNPVLRALNGGAKPALLTVSGPDAYISPDWYGAEDMVPTWNYIAVALSGDLTALPAEYLLPHLARLSLMFETCLLPKPIWLTDKVNPDALSRMLRMIVPVEMSITKVDATWKLGQNKGDAARTAAANGLRATGAEHAALAELMANPPS